MRHLAAILALSLTACGGTVSGSESARIRVDGYSVNPGANLGLSVPENAPELYFADPGFTVEGQGTTLPAPGLNMVCVTISGTMGELQEHMPVQVHITYDGKIRATFDTIRVGNDFNAWTINACSGVSIEDWSPGAVLSIQNDSTTPLYITGESVLSITRLD